MRRRSHLHHWPFCRGGVEGLFVGLKSAMFFVSPRCVGMATKAMWPDWNVTTRYEQRTLTGNTDMIIRSFIPQVAQSQHGIVILLFPLFRINVQGRTALLFFSQSGELDAIGRALRSGSSGISRSLSDLVVVLERVLEDLSSRSRDERWPGGVDG